MGLRTFLPRLFQQPAVEMRRVWIYARHSDRRKAFLAFQRGEIRRKRKLVSRLMPTNESFKSSATYSGGAEAGEGQSILGQLLVKYGSDKASTHDYDTIYAMYARLTGIPTNVVEIGLGTTGRGASSMGPDGHPLASVRAFRDWGSEVIGADIDKSILQDESGIRTYFVDQLRPRTLEHLARRISRPVDLAIIDGLHTPEADLNSLLMLAPRLSPQGLLVVEDIEVVPDITDLWCEVVRVLGPAFRTALIKTKASAVLLLTRAANPAINNLEDLYPKSAGAICRSGRGAG